MSTTRPPTMADVAAAAGVHRTTVSLALRDSPRLPAATRAQIQEVAERLGYRPNPLIAALMTSRVTRRPPKHQATLGFVRIDAKKPRNWPDTQNSYGMMFRGAQERALHRGYLLEPFWLGEPGFKLARFARIMAARNIHGLLIAPHFSPANQIEIDWERFSVVEFGYNLVQPAFHRVVHDYFHSMQTACAKACAAGYKRPGFLMPLHSDAKTHHLWSAAYLHFQSQFPPTERLEIHRPSALNTANVKKWIQAQRPDVVIIGGLHYPLSKGEKHSFDLPARMPYISLDCRDRNSAIPGIFQNWPSMGAAATDMLITQLQRGERGIPQQATSLLVNGVWVDGK